MKEYNEVPVCYCKNCLSLNIKAVEINTNNINYCQDCGSSRTAETSIEDWTKQYVNLYEQPLIEVEEY